MAPRIPLNPQARALLQGVQRVVGRRLATLQSALQTPADKHQIAQAQDVLARIDTALDVAQPLAAPRLLTGLKEPE